MFLWCLRASELGKVLAQEGHANLTPKWSLWTWAQIVKCEVESPSLHPPPGTYRPSWCPLTIGKGVPCGWGKPPPKLVIQLKRELWCQFTFADCRSRSFRCNYFRPLRGWLWDGGRWGWGGMKDGGNEVWLPSGAHIDPLPPILPLLTQSSVASPSPVTGPPPSMH